MRSSGLPSPLAPLLGSSDDLTGDLAAIGVSLGALRGDELDIDVDRSDGQRGAHLRRIGRS